MPTIYFDFQADGSSPEYHSSTGLDEDIIEFLSEQVSEEPDNWFEEPGHYAFAVGDYIEETDEYHTVTGAWFDLVQVDFTPFS